jgi:hypothetical protein
MPRISQIAVAVMLAGATVAAQSVAGDPRGRPQNSHTLAERTLRAHVYPAVSRAPAEVRIEAVIARSDDNRRLEVTIDSEGYYRRTSVELDGARAARVHTVQFRGLPQGTYEVRAVLRGPGRQARATVYDQVIVQ